MPGLPGMPPMPGIPGPFGVPAPAPGHESGDASPPVALEKEDIPFKCEESPPRQLQELDPDRQSPQGGLSASQLDSFASGPFRGALPREGLESSPESSPLVGPFGGPISEACPTAPVAPPLPPSLRGEGGAGKAGPDPPDRVVLSLKRRTLKSVHAGFDDDEDDNGALMEADKAASQKDSFFGDDDIFGSAVDGVPEASTTPRPQQAQPPKDKFALEYNMLFGGPAMTMPGQHQKQLRQQQFQMQTQQQQQYHLQQKHEQQQRDHLMQQQQQMQQVQQRPYQQTQQRYVPIQAPPLKRPRSLSPEHALSGPQPIEPPPASDDDLFVDPFGQAPTPSSTEMRTTQSIFSFGDDILDTAEPEVTTRGTAGPFLDLEPPPRTSASSRLFDDFRAKPTHVPPVQTEASPFVAARDRRKEFLAELLPTSLPQNWNHDVYEEYKSSLSEDLLPTSQEKKYVIANLTTIAKENKEFHLEVLQGWRAARVFSIWLCHFACLTVFLNNSSMLFLVPVSVEVHTKALQLGQFWHSRPL